MTSNSSTTKDRKLRLKQPTGWFAAGARFQRALLLLSDGAFKMFAYLCLQADRRTGQVEKTHGELARSLGKSRRAIGTYVGELENHRICRARAGRNQFAPTVFEIEETYWPYDRLASGPEPSRDRTYVDSVRQTFLSLACGSGKFNSTDEKTARQMEAEGIPVEIVQDAILLGECRKYISWFHSGTSEPIASLRYFEEIIEEVRRRPFVPEYRQYLRTQLQKLSERWNESAKSNKHRSNGGYTGMAPGEIAQ